MMYNYTEERERLWTDEAQREFIKGRDKVLKLVAETGAITMGKAMQHFDLGSSWTMMACVDRMVELGDFAEIHHGPCAGQNRIFGWQWKR